jgi:enoyl-CoA hydratase/carnithine racemase
MAAETISVSRVASASVITLDLAERRNAISLQMMIDLTAALKHAAADSACRAVVITGGTEVFSSGRDLKEAAAMRSPAEAAHVRGAWLELTQTIEELACPVIAAIEGPCLTGGLELALACDLRVAGMGASFGITSARLGTVPGFGATQRLPRLTGVARALDILFSANTIDTEEAYRIGLINRKTGQGGALAEALAMVDVYSDRAPLSLSHIKRAVRRGVQMDIASGLDLEHDLATLLTTTEDRKEGISAFLQKRKPIFHGR